MFFSDSRPWDPAIHLPGKMKIITFEWLLNNMSLLNLLKIDITTRAGEEEFRSQMESGVKLYGICYEPGASKTPAIVASNDFDALLFKTSDVTSPILSRCAIIVFSNPYDFIEYVPGENQRIVLYKKSKHSRMSSIIRKKKYYAELRSISRVIELNDDAFNDADEILSMRLAEMKEHSGKSYGIVLKDTEFTYCGVSETQGEHPLFIVHTLFPNLEGLELCNIIITDDEKFFHMYESILEDKTIILFEHSERTDSVLIGSFYQKNRYFVSAPSPMIAACAIEMDAPEIVEKPTLAQVLVSNKPVYSLVTTQIEGGFEESPDFFQFITNNVNYPVLKKSAVIAVLEDDDLNTSPALPKEVAYDILQQYGVPFVILTPEYDTKRIITGVDKNIYRMTIWRYASIGKDLHAFVESIKK